MVSTLAMHEICQQWQWFETSLTKQPSLNQSHFHLIMFSLLTTLLLWHISRSVATNFEVIASKFVATVSGGVALQVIMLFPDKSNLPVRMSSKLCISFMRNVHHCHLKFFLDIWVSVSCNRCFYKVMDDLSFSVADTLILSPVAADIAPSSGSTTSSPRGSSAD